MNLRVLIVLLGLVIWQSLHLSMVSGNVMFKVEHKFKGVKRTLNEIRTRDAGRHARMLGTANLPLGGNGKPTEAGLYFTKIQLGNPLKDYHLQIDTGSDLMWVNCEGCEQCPKKSGLGIKLNLYDPKGSSSSKQIKCDDSQCSMIYQGSLSGCQSDMLCQFAVTYADGSTTDGFFVQDTLQYMQVFGDSQTTSNGTIVFGCGAKQSGQLSSTDVALDGIIGFGQANSSALSQLAADGKVPKMFSHCLNNEMGGGIFSIGQLVEPKMNSAPLIPNQAHYNIVLNSIEIDAEIVELSSNSSGEVRGAVVDSGSTLTYLPDDIFDKIVDTILSKQPSLRIHDVEDQYKCFEYSGKVDDGFPILTFHFPNDLDLKVHPHEYFFQFDGDKWCVGLMNSGLQSKDGKEVTILGDNVLSNRLVFYDLEDQTIGWTEYDCTSSIKVNDRSSGGSEYTHTYTPVEQVGGSNYVQTPRPWLFVTAIFLVAFS